MLTGIVRSVRKLLAAAGYELIPNWQIGTHHQACYLAKLLKHMNVDVVLDVGGNCGQYGRFLREQVGYKGWIVSFEPIPENADRIEALAKLDARWRVQRVALGKNAGMAEFNVMTNSVFSSFLDPTREGIGDRFGENRVSQKIQVEVRRLDDIWPALQRDLCVTRPYLKLDTQGFDMEVLLGSTATLHHVVALQTEASVLPIYQGMPTWRQMVDHLEGQGFQLSGAYPVSEGGFPYLVEFDCHMVASRHVPPAQ